MRTKRSSFVTTGEFYTARRVALMAGIGSGQLPSLVADGTLPLPIGAHTRTDRQAATSGRYPQQPVLDWLHEIGKAANGQAPACRLIDGNINSYILETGNLNLRRGVDPTALIDRPDNWTAYDRIEADPELADDIRQGMHDAYREIVAQHYPKYIYDVDRPAHRRFDVTTEFIDGVNEWAAHYHSGVGAYRVGGDNEYDLAAIDVEVQSRAQALIKEPYLWAHVRAYTLDVVKGAWSIDIGTRVITGTFEGQ